MGIVAPPSKCPACGADVPWGSDLGGGVHRYECMQCRHAYEIRAVAPAPPFAPAPVNPYAPSPQAAAPPISRMCPQCGKANAPHYQFCLGCGGDLSAAPRPLEVPAGDGPSFRPARKAKRLIASIVGFNGVFWIAFAIMFLSPRACALFGPGNETLAIETLKKCPRSRALLGDDIGPAWVGCTTGSSQGGCDSENAHWQTNVAGSKSSGEFAWAAQETNGKWTIKGAWLRVGGEEVDIVKCNAHGDAKSEDVEIDDSD